MTLEEKLAEISQRAEKAIKGPWEFKDYTSNQLIVTKKGAPICALAGVVAKDAEFEFIAHARQDIPKLLAVIELLIQQRSEWARQVAESREIYDGDHDKWLASLTAIENTQILKLLTDKAEGE